MLVQPSPVPARGPRSGSALSPQQVQTLLVELANLHGVLASLTTRLAGLHMTTPALAPAVAPGRPSRPRRGPFVPLLRQFRLRLGLTQEQAAERIIELARIHEQVELPTTAHIVARHERGVRFPTPIYRRQYRRLYDATDEQLGLVTLPIPAALTESAG